MLNEKDKIGGKKKGKKEEESCILCNGSSLFGDSMDKELRNGIIVLFWSNVE